MKIKNISTTFLLFFFIGILSSHSQSLTKNNIKQAADEKFYEALVNLKTFLEIPNDGNFPEHIEANLQSCKQFFSNLDFTTKQISTAGAPLLFAEKKIDKSAKTVLFYLQIDGQPVDTTAWQQKNPYKPVIKEKIGHSDWKIIPFPKPNDSLNLNWRIFARSASDSKGPAMSFISALQILKDKGIKLKYKLKELYIYYEIKK